MGTVGSDKKLSDMTAKELQDLIRQTILEVLDPDYGLQIKPEIVESLRKSLEQKKKGKGISIEKVEKELGLL
jgi:hypothetical protein